MYVYMRATFNFNTTHTPVPKNYDYSFPIIFVPLCMYFAACQCFLFVITYFKYRSPRLFVPVFFSLFVERERNAM